MHVSGIRLSHLDAMGHGEARAAETGYNIVSRIDFDVWERGPKVSGKSDRPHWPSEETF